MAKNTNAMLNPTTNHLPDPSGDDSVSVCLHSRHAGQIVTPYVRERLLPRCQVEIIYGWRDAGDRSETRETFRGTPDQCRAKLRAEGILTDDSRRVVG